MTTHQLLAGPSTRPPPFRPSRKAKAMQALAPPAAATASTTTTPFLKPHPPPGPPTSTRNSNATAQPPSRTRPLSFVKQAERVHRELQEANNNTSGGSGSGRSSKSQSRRRARLLANKKPTRPVLMADALLDIDALRTAAKTSKLATITALALPHAYLTQIDVRALQTCTALTQLDLGFNRLDQEALSPALKSLRMLSTVALNSNRLRALPDFGPGRQQLTTLLLQDNVIDTLPAQSHIHDCRKLRKLWLHNNAISGTLEARALPTSLTSLDLSGNKLTNADALATLVQLRELMINQNQLTALPNLSACDVLDEVQAADNRLTSCRSLGCPKQLAVLVVSGNAIASVDELPLHADALYELEIAGNGLQSLEGIALAAPALESLDVSRNALSDVQGTLTALAGLTKLEDLYVLGNAVVGGGDDGHDDDQKDALLAFRNLVKRHVPHICFVDVDELLGDEQEGTHSAAAAAAAAEQETTATMASERATPTEVLLARTQSTLRATGLGLRAHKDAVARILADAKSAIARAGLQPRAVRPSSTNESGAGEEAAGSNSDDKNPAAAVSASSHSRKQHERLFSKVQQQPYAPRSRYRARSEHFEKAMLAAAADGGSGGGSVNGDVAAAATAPSSPRVAGREVRSSQRRGRSGRGARRNGSNGPHVRTRSHRSSAVASSMPSVPVAAAGPSSMAMAATAAAIGPLEPIANQSALTRKAKEIVDAAAASDEAEDMLALMEQVVARPRFEPRLPIGQRETVLARATVDVARAARADDDAVDMRLMGEPEAGVEALARRDAPLTLAVADSPRLRVVGAAERDVGAEMEAMTAEVNSRDHSPRYDAGEGKIDADAAVAVPPERADDATLTEQPAAVATAAATAAPPSNTTTDCETVTAADAAEAPMLPLQRPMSARRQQREKRVVGAREGYRHFRMPSRRSNTTTNTASINIGGAVAPRRASSKGSGGGAIHAGDSSGDDDDDEDVAAGSGDEDNAEEEIVRAVAIAPGIVRPRPLTPGSVLRATLEAQQREGGRQQSQRAGAAASLANDDNDKGIAPPRVAEAAVPRLNLNAAATPTTADEEGGAVRLSSRGFRSNRRR